MGSSRWWRYGVLLHWCGKFRIRAVSPVLPSCASQPVRNVAVTFPRSVIPYCDNIVLYSNAYIRLASKSTSDIHGISGVIFYYDNRRRHGYSVAPGPDGSGGL